MQKQGAERGSVGSLAVVRCMVVLAAVLAFAPMAAAQQPRDLDLPRFEPASAGDVFFGVPSAYTPGRTVLRGGALIDYAHNPLVITDSDGNTLGRVVAHQMLLHVNVALTLIDRVQLNLDLPMAVVNRGDGTFEAGTFTGPDAFVSPSGAGLGDLRAGARLRILGAHDEPFQLALGGYLWLPTAARNDFLTDGKVRGQVHLLAGGRVDRLVWTGMVGPTIRSSQTYGGVATGTQLTWGAGIGVLLREARDVQLGVETIGGATLSGSVRSTNSEVLLGAKVRTWAPLEVGVAIGRGISSGLGTPDFRGIFGVFYSPRVEKDVDSDEDGVLDGVDACPRQPGPASSDPERNGCPPPASDGDGDGIADASDACPAERGAPNADPKKNGCPPRDSDKDGILDDVDACPTVAGVSNADPAKNGCPPPPDSDGDGIPDGEDACPKIAGIRSSDPGTNGCPGDADGDGIRDDRDACPKEKGVDDSDPAKRGCPRLVRVTKDEIVILEQVQFDTNKAKIKPGSDPLLTALAQVLGEHPEILKVEVQGHTDSRGKRKRNAKLSQDRAEAVAEALSSRGVAAGRLSAKGFGQEVPIAPNDTAEGRQKNRRVQFLVVDRKAEASDVPAPVSP